MALQRSRAGHKVNDLTVHSRVNRQDRYGTIVKGWVYEPDLFLWE